MEDSLSIPYKNIEGKREIASRAIPPFPSMFSKLFMVRTYDCKYEQSQSLRSANEPTRFDLVQHGKSVKLRKMTNQ